MPLKTHLDEQPTLNLTSMMDVVFLLIIFFMVGTTFTDPERNVELQVPEVQEAGALTAAPERKVVNVFPDGRMMLDRQPVSLAELEERLTTARAEYPALGVLVRGDAASPLQQVADVLTVCQRAGVADLGIAVRTKQR